MPWGETQLLVLGLMRRTDSMLYADLTDAKYALSVTDIHLIYLSVAWMNAHREKGAQPLSAPRLFEDTGSKVVVTDEDREQAEALLRSWSTMPD